MVRAKEIEKIHSYWNPPSLPRESCADDATLVDTSYLSQEEKIKPETE